jgi:hypothetical protein
MSTLSKTRAAAVYAGQHSHSDLARTAATVVLQRVSACEAALAGADSQPPAVAAGPLRALVQAVRGLVGPAWLKTAGDDPDVAAFTVLETTASPPDPAHIDDICSAVLWARYAPANHASTHG